MKSHLRDRCAYQPQHSYLGCLRGREGGREGEDEGRTYCLTSKYFSIGLHGNAASFESTICTIPINS